MRRVLKPEVVARDVITHRSAGGSVSHRTPDLSHAGARLVKEAFSIWIAVLDSTGVPDYSRSA
jgi:hypothetical protein